MVVCVSSDHGIIRTLDLPIYITRVKVPMISLFAWKTVGIVLFKPESINKISSSEAMILTVMDAIVLQLLRGA